MMLFRERNAPLWGQHAHFPLKAQRLPVASRPHMLFVRHFGPVPEAKPAVLPSLPLWHTRDMQVWTPAQCTTEWRNS